MNLSLTGKNALVCGGSRGIGLAIANELALLGANCTLAARDENALRDALQGLDISLRQSHQIMVLDLSKTEEVKQPLLCMWPMNRFIYW